MRAALDDPLMEDFVARLEPLNALADSMPGFVWRLQTDEGDATSVQAFDDPLILVNLSVWESVEALETYIYRSDHVSALQQRAEWFDRPEKSPFALWWVSADHIPSVEEAKARLETLWQHGPTADAFTFRRRFEPDDAAD
jgi:Domain of unknown function (DUF3291)